MNSVIVNPAVQLKDLTDQPRFGLKGSSMQSWHDAQSYRVGDESNRAYAQHDGYLAVRLSPRELIFLSDPENQPLAMDHNYMLPGRECYFIRRQDSHFWFSISGSATACMLAKICGVNFEPGNFPNKQVAQTQVARISTIVIRNDKQKNPVYHLLADISYITYMKVCLLDAMREYQ